MSTLLLTLGIAFVAFLAAMALLGIGWLLSGKSRIIRGACGMDPKKLRDKKCGTTEIHCDLCDSKKKETTKNHE